MNAFDGQTFCLVYLLSQTAQHGRCREQHADILDGKDMQGLVFDMLQISLGGETPGEQLLGPTRIEVNSEDIPGIKGLRTTSGGPADDMRAGWPDEKPAAAGGGRRLAWPP